MNKPLTFVLSGSVLLAAGVGMLSASAQDRTPQPGQLAQGKVWIQNRGDTEAIPVSIQSLAPDAPPLRVQVIGGPTVTTNSGNVVQDRVARQPWEYQNVNIPQGQDLVALLNAAGADGWDTSGISFVTQSGTVVVMKRPR